MKLAILMGSLSRLGGGSFESISSFVKLLSADSNINIHVLGLNDAYTKEDLLQWTPIKPRIFPIRGITSFGYAPGMLQSLVEFDPDLLHQHAIWMYPSFAALKWGRKAGKPYLVSTRGMLDTWALKNSSWKKKIAGWLFENEHLKMATCLHALCSSEVKSIRSYGLHNPVCLIPNGVDLIEQEVITKPPWNSEEEEGRKVLLYLGRIHPKKGLINLLHAWSLLTRKDKARVDEWVLVIGGWDQLSHEMELKALAKDLGIQNKVIFIGPQFGENKQAAYHHADAFVLPSFSEGLPMTILEAWANRLPVLMTPECNLPEGFHLNAGIRILTEVDGIYEGLHKMLLMSDNERTVMGESGLKLIKEHFLWSKIVSNMLEVYEWILGGGHPPSCVIID